MIDDSHHNDTAPTESGCAVDWSWLAGRVVASARSDLQSMTLVFSDGEALTIRAAIYRDQPFLAFDPWKAR
ncbi:MAG: hypothetical protein IT307_11800 [Chloroflexi bacterium]|nr:hypothetical protein [Chloroflexota bacterium]